MTSKTTFEPIAYDVPRLEICAGYLEAIRSSRSHSAKLTGAFGGYYIFAEPAGVFVAPNLSATPMRALVRTDDGRLAPPALVSDCATLSAGGDRRLFQTVTFASCVKRLIECRCADSLHTVSGRWASVVFGVTASQISVLGLEGRSRAIAQYSGCSPQVY